MAENKRNHLDQQEVQREDRNSQPGSTEKRTSGGDQNSRDKGNLNQGNNQSRQGDGGNRGKRGNRGLG